jgi:hypothetical protein
MPSKASISQSMHIAPSGSKCEYFIDRTLQLSGDWDHYPPTSPTRSPGHMGRNRSESLEGLQLYDD